MIEQINNADRALDDSLELMEKATAKTASKPTKQSAR